MRKFKVLVLGLVLVFVIAAPAAAEHGAQFEGLWIARDNVDGSRMMLEISEFPDETGNFRVVFTDTRATGGCEPRPARFRALSTTATGDPGNGRFFAPFDQMRCFGRSTVNPVLLPGFEIQFCSVNFAVHCEDPVDPDPNIMIDLILDNEGNVIGSGNVWYRVHR